MLDINELKKQAAEQAVDLLESGMVVGLGTGSSAIHAMYRIAGGIPAHGNQRSKWDAGCRFDFPNPEYR